MVHFPSSIRDPFLSILLFVVSIAGCESTGTGPDPDPDPGDPDPLAVSTSSLPGAVVSAAYSAALAATGGDGSYSWGLSSGALPAGLSLASSGTISGTPTTPGSEAFTVQVQSGDGQTASTPLSLDVSAPGSSTTLFTESFDDANAASRGWFDNTSFTISTTESVSPPAALELRFAPGATTPDFGGAARVLFTATPTVYLSYWVKYASNWVGSGIADHPHELYLLTTEDNEWVGPSFTASTFYIEHTWQSGVVPRLQVQDGSNIDQSQINVDLSSVTESRAANGCNGTNDAHAGGCYSLGNGSYNNERRWDAPSAVLVPSAGPNDQNDWHFVEVYFEMNSIQGGIGQADGMARYWMDGNLILDIQNIMFRTGATPNMEFRELLIGPYIGVGSPADQTFWIDDIRVADQR